MIGHKKTLLACTPTFTGGSWVVVEDILKLLTDWNLICVGFGKARKLPNVKFIEIPYYSFEKLNPVWGRNIFFNFIFQIPLQLGVLFSYFIYQPSVILANGFTSLIFLLPLSMLFRTKIIVYYGSFLKDWFKFAAVREIVAFGSTFVSHVFVNSYGSFEDISRVVPKNKITVIEHWTDLKPQTVSYRNSIREKFGYTPDELVIFSPNRFIPEKGIETLLKIIPLTKSTKIKFVFAGDGVLKNEIENLAQKDTRVKYVGFISSRETLLEYYVSSDIVWGIGDETYLGKPAVESLALGIPIMILDVAGIYEKYHSGVLIRKDLVPERIGWFAQKNNPNATAVLIDSLSLNLDTVRSMSSNCIDYASERYSSKNILKAKLILQSYA